MKKMHSTLTSSIAAAALVSLAVACLPGNDVNDGVVSNGGSGGAPGSGAGTTVGTSDGGTTSQFMNGPGGGPVDPGDCESTPDQDADEDGWTGAQGDCNDCDANTNPGAIEVIPDPSDGTGGGGGVGEYLAADEDCDGTPDNVLMPCDEGLAIAGTDAMDAARAIELCKQTTGDQDYGVVSATWVRAGGGATPANLHMGILDGFGTNVTTREGARMLALSSGTARDASDPGFCSHSCGENGSGSAPPGFPQPVPGCPVGDSVYDDVGLQLQLRAPTNATGYRFEFKFYSNEYPEWVCDEYNDQFIALVAPAPMGSQNGNISFDSAGNPVSVNIAFFDVCQGCPLGTGELQGTGFGNAEGGTSWLQTTAPVTGGEEISLRFATWDTGDEAFDSTTLIDNFEWIASGGTVIIGTTPTPPE
jgi:hypothetical protein